MKKERFFELLNDIDDDLINRAENGKTKQVNRRSLWIRVTAIAACFSLIIGAVIAIPLMRGPSSDNPIATGDSTENTSHTVYDPNHNPIIFDATISPDKINGSALEFVVGSSASINDAVSPGPPLFEFDVHNFVVKAKVVKSFPDLYYKLDVSSEYKPSAYRLIEMETIETYHGKNMPQHFLYLIEDYLFVDLSVYDSLLISMYQIGTENYVLRNGTKNQMEFVSLPVFTDYHPELGNIIAFTDGVFDESLWQTKSWNYGYQFAQHELDDPENSDLVVSRGCSESDAIAEIVKRISAWDEWQGTRIGLPTVFTPDFTSEEARAALEYVKPFENGVFSQRLAVYVNGDGVTDGVLLYTRYINGCETEEEIRIDLCTEAVTYSEVRYTKEDLSAIEDITAHISEKAAAYAAKIPLPPHTDPEGKDLLSLHLYGWYAKVGDRVYGIVKTGWRHKDGIDWGIQYYDEAYTLYDSAAGTARDISREELLEFAGERNIHRGEFSVGIEIPMC